ncbi:MAG: DUF5709 domain-containing protein [Brooklawnia sp.]|uniref:DUF5709 domain-containing protein n=1 Tax=Brooklawnia sp. TaxID=2699740 RepID=UPI003C75925C
MNSDAAFIDDTPESSSEQLDQQGPADSLIDRGVDPMEEGYTAPENWSPAQGFGNTAAEMKQGETIEQRVEQEVPEKDPHKLRGPWNPTGEPREVGSKRAGRLVATENGSIQEDKESTVVAEDVGIDGAAASAEEAAMHIISEEDLRNQGDEDLDGDDEEA